MLIQPKQEQNYGFFLLDIRQKTISCCHSRALGNEHGKSLTHTFNNIPCWHRTTSKKIMFTLRPCGTSLSILAIAKDMLGYASNLIETIFPSSSYTAPFTYFVPRFLPLSVRAYKSLIIILVCRSFRVFSLILWLSVDRRAYGVMKSSFKLNKCRGAISR